MRSLLRPAVASVLFATLLASARGESSRSTGHDYDPPAPGSYVLPVIRAAADGEVIDASGRTLPLHELTRGRVTILSFIYTRCASANACPMATGVLRELQQFSRKDPALAGDLRLLSLSFDPANDTPERMAEYAALVDTSAPSAEWRFLTTASPDQLQPILHAYDQAVDRKDDPADPTGPLSHTLRVFLIDAAGDIRNIYSAGTLDVRLILADIETLRLEARTRAPQSE